MLLPALSMGRERARRTTCMNNLRQFAMAYEMYAADFYEKFPSDQFALFGGDRTIYPHFINSLLVFWCPSANNRNLPKPNGAIGQYHANPPLDNDWRLWRNDWYGSYSFVFGLTASNKSPRAVPVVSDRGIYYNGDVNVYSNLKYAYENYDLDPKTGNHRNGINVLYLDGSACWLNLQDIDFSLDDTGGVSPDDATFHMGNVAARPNGYSVVVGLDLSNPDNEKEEWGQ